MDILTDLMGSNPQKSGQLLSYLDPNVVADALNTYPELISGVMQVMTSEAMINTFDFNQQPYDQQLFLKMGIEVVIKAKLGFIKLPATHRWMNLPAKFWSHHMEPYTGPPPES